MKLTSDEKAWIKAYRKALREHYPGMVERLLIYGSKALKGISGKALTYRRINA